MSIISSFGTPRTPSTEKRESPTLKVCSLTRCLFSTAGTAGEGCAGGAASGTACATTALSSGSGADWSHQRPPKQRTAKDKINTHLERFMRALTIDDSYG